MIRAAAILCFTVLVSCLILAACATRGGVTAGFDERCVPHPDTVTVYLTNATSSQTKVYITRIQVKLKSASGNRLGTIERGFKHPRRLGYAKTRRWHLLARTLTPVATCTVSGIWYNP